MKKIRISLMFIFTFLMSGLVLAQGENLAKLSLGFCTGEVADTVSYVMSGGEEQEICYVMHNGGDSDLNVKIGFVDGAFTNDEWSNRACMLDTQVSNFGQYVTDYEGVVSLEAGESFTGIAVVKYPTDTNGIFHGCLAYSLLAPQSDSQGGGTSVTIQMRRAKFIDLLVGDLDAMGKNGIILDEFTSEDGKNLSSNPKVRIYQDPLDNKYVIALRLKNMGSFDENVVATGIASNVLTYKESFVFERKMIKGDTLLLTQKLDTLPLYNLHTKIALSHKPILIGDLELETSFINESAGFIIWNIITILTLLGIVVVVLIIVLLIKDITKKSRNKKIAKKKVVKKRK